VVIASFLFVPSSGARLHSRTLSCVPGRPVGRRCQPAPNSVRRRAHLLRREPAFAHRHARAAVATTRARVACTVCTGTAADKPQRRRCAPSLCRSSAPPASHQSHTDHNSSDRVPETSINVSSHGARDHERVCCSSGRVLCTKTSFAIELPHPVCTRGRCGPAPNIRNHLSPHVA